MDFDEYPSQDLDDAEFQEMGQEAKEGSRRGRKPGRKSSDRGDAKSKLERSRQSARECRARKKLRYQYLEELVADREAAVFALRKELEKYKQWNKDLDEGRIPENLQALLEEMGAVKEEQEDDVAMLLQSGSSESAGAARGDGCRQGGAGGQRGHAPLEWLHRVCRCCSRRWVPSRRSRRTM